MSDQLAIGNTVAPIQTVLNCMTALNQAMNRADHLPGIVALYGPSGVGKSKGATLCANSTQAYYVEMRSAWTKKKFLQSILKEMGIKPENVIADMLDQICEELALSQRPLIIDEADYAVDKNMLDLIRDIYEGSNAPILLIGEEQLSSKILRRSERFHNRMLHWAKAEPATPGDAKALRDFYGAKAGVSVSDDLVEHIRNFNKGCVRRLCVNLERVHQEAKRQGLESINREQWGTRELYSGSPNVSGRQVA
jgi:DNA transposition AAA+ family ATPase